VGGRGLHESDYLNNSKDNLCECGNKVAVRGDRLRSKNPPESCGCLKTINEVRNAYGKLTVEALDKMVVGKVLVVLLRLWQ
jgi:hypothetical protein